MDPTDTAARPPQGGSALLAYLLFTTTITGGLVMVVEVLGSRVIGPFFGVSLFVWTALITVALMALAVGYAVGGLWADRHPQPGRLYALILAAGVLVALVPWLKPWVIQAALPLGLRAGAFASALLLFGPPLFLLGCVSPWVVRIATREWRRLGRTVGLFYALSTTGSFAGTVLTGYFLIGYVGVAQTFFMCGLLLVLLAVGYFVLFGRRRAVLALPVVLLALLPRTHTAEAVTGDGTRVTVTHAQDSFYGNIKVVDYRHGANHTRELIIDGLVQGGVDVTNGLSVYEYTYALQQLPRELHPDGRDCLVVGLGAGILPSWYAARGYRTEAVDIDPEVVTVARRYFRLDPRVEVHVEDARTFLARGERRYDYIILDVFNGDTTPGHLLSVEAMRLVQARLAPGGVLGINLMGSLGEHGAMTASVVKTLRAVFAAVEVHPGYDTSAPDASGNFVILAHDRPGRERIALPEERIHPLAEAAARHGMRTTVDIPDRPDAVLLTDDFNPIDVRDIWLKERVRRIILDTTPLEILLGAAGTALAA
jgi:spermidine synthase